METDYIPHPVYDERLVRAVFNPQDTEGLNAGAQQMVGHEFVWRHVGYSVGMPVWMLADPEDIDSYFEVAGRPRQGWQCLWIFENDLDTMKLEKLDG